jgi:acetyl-CoA decarbonylase/synthase complex subunit beta
MPSGIKEQMKPFIPAELFDKIPTEKDVKNVDELREFLLSHGHPVVNRWKASEEKPEEPAEIPVFSGGDIPVNFGGFKVTFKNARIYADRVIIQSVKPKKPGTGE